jgi:tetratricopeptide (TPR) repeat protein
MGVYVAASHGPGSAHQGNRSSGAGDPLRETFLQLQQAESLRLHGQIDQARAICEGLVGRYPEYFGALYTLGLIYLDKDQYPQALGCLVRASMLNPESWRALTALSAVYLELGAREMAAHTLERATAIEPEDPSILLTLGEIYTEEREYELAHDAYRKALDLDSNMEAAALNLGSCYAHLGQYTKAAQVFEQLLKRGMRSLAAISELINLPRPVVSIDLDSEFEKIIKHEAGDGDFKNSASFIRAALLNRAGRYADAWRHLVQANQELFLIHQNDAAELVETQRRVLDLARQRAIRVRGVKGGKSEPMSLFILGPSRSGKTTMETLVGTLVGVKRGYENPIVENAIRRTFQGAGLLTASMFEVLPTNLDSQCSELYLKELRRRAESAKVFTNTHPGRIQDAARVVAAFPNVRLIFVKRNRDDNMVRIFFRKYPPGNAYAYQLKTIANYIDWYHEMTDTLAEKLPDITRVIHYENMVADPAAALRVAADLCQLPMNHTPLPQIGDDRGCAEPYRAFMSAALAD